MTALPAATDFTGSAITEAQFKTAITNMRGYLSGLLGTDGDPVTALAALDAIFAAGVDAKSGAYTVVTGDRGKMLDCTGTWTLTLPTAATAGAGFAVAVRNSGSGTITVDPDSTEQIDGATTTTFAAGESAVLISTGTAWVTVGRTDAVRKDHGGYQVGSICLLLYKGTIVANGSIPVGDTKSGSLLASVSCWGSSDDKGDAVAWAVSTISESGTWRAIETMYNPTGYSRYLGGLWQRIA